MRRHDLALTRSGLGDHVPLIALAIGAGQGIGFPPLIRVVEQNHRTAWIDSIYDRELSARARSQIHR